MRKAPALLLSLAALAVVAVQAMALATRYFQPWLDGDYLLPQRFAVDVLGGIYPLSGWTLSSSPYLFPDFALSVLWHAVLGGAPLLPFYVVTSYVALALLAGWSLQRVHPTAGIGWLAGALLVNVLLAWQGMADHARWLWWLGTATFHGGAVLLGLAQFALWAGPTETAPSRARYAIATTLLFLGLASDTLLLTQFILPLGLALFVTAGRPRWRAPRVRAFVTAVVTAFLLIAALRGLLLLADWWNFPKVVRHAPTPAAITETAGRMLGDLAGSVPAAVPGFVALFFIGLAGSLWLIRRQCLARFLHRLAIESSAELQPAHSVPQRELKHRATPNHGHGDRQMPISSEREVSGPAHFTAQSPKPTWKFVIHYMTNLQPTAGGKPVGPDNNDARAGAEVARMQAAWFVVASLATTLLLPVLAVYWQNPQHGRYLLPCLVLPLWWLLTLLPTAKLRTPLAAGIAIASLLGIALWRAPQIDFSKWAWPYPEQVAELDKTFSQEGHVRGLADFWNANYLNAVSHKLCLNQIRADGRVQFWGNNAFQHFTMETPGATLHRSFYSFIITNGLDPAALRAKFGEPSRTVTVGSYEVWLYDEAGAERVSALVDAEVRAFLGDRPGTERIAP